MSTPLQNRGAVHVCTNNFNLTRELLQKLYQQHCNSNQTIGKRVCSIDVNRQFIVVGSDEYVNGIYDPQSLQTDPSLPARTKPDFCPDVPHTLSEPKVSIESSTLDDMHTVLQRNNKEYAKNMKTLQEKKIEYRKPEDIDKLHSVLQLLQNNERKKNENEVLQKEYNELRAATTDADRKQLLYKKLHTALLGSPPSQQLPTQDGDVMQANRNSICKNRKAIPKFFPKGLYEAAVATHLPPVCFTLAEFMDTFSPATMQVFADLVSKGYTLDEAKPRMPVSKKLFYRNNPFYPKKRIRPLVTYPEEERDHQPRFRPLYNTVLVLADADNMNLVNPDALEFLMKLVRHEPTCEAHYCISELQNDDTAFLTNMCDSLRVPPIHAPVDVEAYDVQSGKWAPVAIVQEEGNEILVRFKEAVLQTGRAKVFTVRPSLVRKWTRCDALTSPDILRQFLKQHNIRVVAHICPPRLKDVSEIVDEHAGVTETDKAAVRCALQEKRMGDTTHTLAVRLKLYNILTNLKDGSIHGKMMVVAPDKCIDLYAQTVRREFKGDDGLSVLDLKDPKAWRKLNKWAGKKQPKLGRLVLLIRTLAHWAELAGAFPTPLKRRTAAYFVGRSVFEQSGVPRTLGIRHLYLMGKDVRLAVLTQTGKSMFGGLGDEGSGQRFTALTVWKYIVSSPDDGKEANHQANKAALQSVADQPFRLPTPLGSESAAMLGRWTQTEFIQPEVPSLEGPEGLSRVMDAMDFLRTVDDEEQRVFHGSLYQSHAKTGPTMQSILDAFEKARAERFDPSEVLAMCKQWSERVRLHPKLHDRVLAAVQVVLNSETYRSYVTSTQRTRCSGLRRRMAVQVALLQKIKRETAELARLTQSMRIGLQKNRRPKLLVLLEEGGAIDIVKRDRRSPEASGLLAHVAAKQQMLESARRATLLELGRLWEQFRRCPRSIGPGGQTLSFVPLQQFAGKANLYSDALSSATAFQQTHGVPTEGGLGQVLLFNDLAAVLPSGRVLRGGLSTGLPFDRNINYRGLIAHTARNAGIPKNMLKKYITRENFNSFIDPKTYRSTENLTELVDGLKGKAFAVQPLEPPQTPVPTSTAVSIYNPGNQSPLPGPSFLDVAGQATSVYSGVKSAHGLYNEFWGNASRLKQLQRELAQPGLTPQRRDTLLQEQNRLKHTIEQLQNRGLLKKGFDWASKGTSLYRGVTGASSLYNTATALAPNIGAYAPYLPALAATSYALYDGYKLASDPESYHKNEIQKIDEQLKDESLTEKEKEDLKQKRKEYYNENIQTEIEEKNRKKILKKIEKANVRLPQQNYEALDSRWFDNQHPTLLNKNLLGKGRGKERHLQTLRLLAEGVQVSLQPDAPPQFRFDPIVGEKAKLFLMHNLEVTQTMSDKRATNYRRYIQNIRIRQAEELGKMTMGNMGKTFLKNNWKTLATTAGLGAFHYLGGTALLKTGAAATVATLGLPVAATLGGIAAAGYGAYKLAQSRNKNIRKRQRAILRGNLQGGFLPDDGLSQALGQVMFEEAEDPTALSGGGGTWSPMPNAVVYVDPQNATLDSLTQMWEKGLSMIPDEPPLPIPTQLRPRGTLFSRRNEPEILRVESEVSYVQVLLEESQNCSTDIDIPYVRGALQTDRFRCADHNTRPTITDKTDGAFDLLFVGSGGRSHTMLWTVNPKLRVECSVLVSG